MLECAFCAIINGQDVDAHVVHRTRDTVSFLPLNPASLGHTLVVPTAHVTDFLALPEDVAQSMTTAVLQVSRAVRDAVSPEGMNLITSAGEAASQSVFHLHVHIVPRWKGDRIGDIWPPDEKSDEEVQNALVARIRQAVGR